MEMASEVRICGLNGVPERPIPADGETQTSGVPCERGLGMANKNVALAAVLRLCVPRTQGGGRGWGGVWPGSNVRCGDGATALKTSDLDYQLPAGRIALTPAEPRDSARMMVVSRSDPSRVEHRTVRDLPALLGPGDVMFFNTTRVVPARLMGVRSDTGGRVEGLYLAHAPQAAGSSDSAAMRERWIVLLRAKRLREGIVIDLEAPADGVGVAAVRLRLVARHGETAGAWVVEVVGDSITDRASPLDRVGRTPLPPYILKARRDSGVNVGEEQDRCRYQTVYATRGSSVAAPTAGLHFTPELLASLTARGVDRADVRLDVGTGTFRPIESERVEDHPMHAEWCSVEAAAARTIRSAKAPGGLGRVIAVGTTTARTLEAFADPILHADLNGSAWPISGETRILIAPGHRWGVVDGLLTNFHLPRSTLLAMVGALFPGGVERVKELYGVAIAEEYRFYSYGDAMLVLP